LRFEARSGAPTWVSNAQKNDRQFKGSKTHKKTLAMPLPALVQLKFRPWQKVSLVGERAGRQHPDLANYICHQRFPQGGVRIGKHHEIAERRHQSPGQAERYRLRGMSGDGQLVVPSAPMCRMRSYRLLRYFAQSARDKALSRD